MASKYDIMVVGAGLFGATCARLLTNKGYKCLIVEKNNYVGGLCATKRQNNIDVHIHGPHIFHTKNKNVWDFVNTYAKFNEYKHVETMIANGKIWSLPIDILAYNTMFSSIDAIHAYKDVKAEIDNYNVKQSTSFEDTLIMQYGTSIYVELFKNYYEKKYNKECSKLAPIMPDMQPSYFKLAKQMYETPMQGIPENGYTAMVENIIGNDIPILLNKDFVVNIDKMHTLADIIIYTGPIDALGKYVYGPLDWACAEIKTADESMRGTQIYGNAVTKVSDKNTDLIRITEHKWFNPERMSDKDWMTHNIVTYEHMKKWTVDDYPMYAIMSNESIEKYKKYEKHIYSILPNIVMGGTKGIYINMSMDETIQAAFDMCEKIKTKIE